jgi:hypothetical protein
LASGDRFGARLVVLELFFVQAGTQAALPQQLSMRSALHDSAAVVHEDLVGRRIVEVAIGQLEDPVVDRDFSLARTHRRNDIPCEI